MFKRKPKPDLSEKASKPPKLSEKSDKKPDTTHERPLPTPKPVKTEQMAMSAAGPPWIVRPSEKAPGKYEVVFHDGSVHPYAFRTFNEAIVFAQANNGV